MLHFSALDDGLLETLVQLDGAIFPEPFSKTVLARQLQPRKNLCVLVAESERGPCGYKIGYEESVDVFFSFSGGVVADSRRQGVANALLIEQHKIARKLGYRFVRTHTKNKYREMLILNIRAGFNITGVNHKLGERFQSIILEKSLTLSRE